MPLECFFLNRENMDVVNKCYRDQKKKLFAFKRTWLSNPLILDIRFDARTSPHGEIIIISFYN